MSDANSWNSMRNGVRWRTAPIAWLEPVRRMPPRMIAIRFLRGARHSTALPRPRGCWKRNAEARIPSREGTHCKEAVESAARFGLNGNEVVRDGADDDVGAAMGRIKRDATDALWEAAVTKHGADVVERANDLLTEIDAARDRIDRVQAEGRSADEAEQDYATALNEAAKLALAGNSYMREVAETDEALRRAVEAADRAEKGKHAATRVNAGEDERSRDVGDETELGSDVRANPADLEISAGADHEQRRPERRERGSEAAPQTGETNRTEPAQQHVPRLEELELESSRGTEPVRDRDDFER